MAIQSRGVQGDKRGFLEVKTNWGHVQDSWSLHVCAPDTKIPECQHKVLKHIGSLLRPVKDSNPPK